MKGSFDPQRTHNPHKVGTTGLKVVTLRSYKNWEEELLVCLMVVYRQGFTL